MMKRKMNASPPNKGQGALEYLLLIGGAVLVATVVLVMVLSTSSSTNTIVANNISTFQHQITLNAGGGGGGGNCGNGAIDAGEQCDGANLNSQTCVGLGFTGGTLSCNANCTFNTTSCTSPPTDTTAPNFAAFVGTVPNSYGGTVRADLTWTASDVTTPIRYAGTNPGLAREDGGQTTLNTMTAVANFSGQSGITYQSPANNATTFNDTDATLDDTGLRVGQQSCYNMMYCDSVSPTPNCAVNPVGNIVCATPWQAVLFEAESYTSAGANLLSGPHTDTAAVTETVIYDDPATCSGAGNNQATYTAMINFSDHVASTPYRAWIRMATNDTTTTAMNVITRIGAAAFGNPIPAGTTPGTAYTWVQSSLDSTAVADGAQGFTVIIPCGHTGTGESTWIDKVLFTTNVSCTPVGNGSNCT